MVGERIHGAIEIIPAQMSPGLALDISAGDGRSSAMLAERGWRVISTEWRPRRAGWVAVNLNHGLPFRAARFDLVLMLEVVEHLADIPQALGEVARVLRPGGIAVISTPNRLNLSSRLHYLLSGFYKGRRAPLPYRYKVEDGRNWHVMGLNDFHWMAHGAGLRLDALGKSRRKFKTQILAVALYPAIAPYSWFLYGRGGDDCAQRELNRELFRLMTSASCLVDENLVMRFRRT